MKEAALKEKMRARGAGEVVNPADDQRYGAALGEDKGRRVAGEVANPADAQVKG